MATRQQRPSLGAAQQLRANATPAETLLWKFLRSRHTHKFKFRRQHEAGPYVLDFYCAEARLVVEVDGGIHAERKPFDAARTQWLESQGLAVLRFTNDDVLSDVETVAKRIGTVCNERIAAQP
ncbi:MAG TPA: endonuclease domain-containing protein [bacterium]